MSGFANERTVIGTLLNGNWSTTTIEWPGVNFTPPSKTGDASDPAAWLSFELENVFAERLTPHWVQRDCAVEVGYYEEIAGQGDRLMRQRIDTLMGIFREAHTSTIYFDEPYLEPSQPDISGDEEWMFAQIRIPYRRFSDVSTDEVLTLAGQGSTQMVITETAHGLSETNAAGLASGTWQKAIADASGPYSNGLVSTVIDADTFMLTTVGTVRLESHGWSEGKLYLDQSTAGALTSSAPTTGVVQHVATAVDANRVIVHEYLPADIT